MSVMICSIAEWVQAAKRANSRAKKARPHAMGWRTRPALVTVEIVCAASWSPVSLTSSLSKVYPNFAGEHVVAVAPVEIPNAVA